MVRDRLFELERARLQPPISHELGDHLAVVQHFEVAAELRVLVGERIEAVRALGDDLLHAVAVERLDVLLRERLEEVFVAQAARGVAIAGLLLAEDDEVHLRRLQDLHERA